MLWTSLTLNTLVIVPLLVLAVIALWNFRPLHRTWQWHGEASTHAGKPAPVKVYKEFGRDVFFLRVDDARYTPFGQKYPRWFVADFSVKEKGVVVSADPHTSIGIAQYLTVERWYGVNILYNKHEGKKDWHLSYTGNSVVFSNDAFFVSMSK